ncbi:MAG: hypothetical protein IJH94_01480 [Clostridia bacterium]|nr:hypothetical protein [Clostridia bacterium]
MNSIKDLIKESTDLIDKGWDFLGNKNISYCPVILVYLGETAHYNREPVLKTLNNNWKNSSYIEQILVPLDYSGNDAVLLANEEQDSGAREVKGSLDSLIDICIRSRILKNSEGIFADKRRIFVEIISACEDISGIAMLNDVIKPINTLKGVEVWKSLYLVIDQSDSGTDKQAMNLLREMDKNEDTIFSANGFRQIYILSNYLCGGSILSETEMSSNYRSISDILLLKNNYNIELGERTGSFEKLNEQGAVRTLSYNLVEKPCREIAIATYMGLISEMVNVTVSDNIHSAFNTSEFTFFNDYYQREIETRIPGERAMEYLAWIPEELDRLKKMPVINTDVLDRATMGQWSAFFDSYYRDLVNNEINEADFRNSFHYYLKSKFNYKEMRDSFNREDIDNVIRYSGATQIAAGRDNLFRRTAYFGTDYVRGKYYNDYVAPIFRATLDRLYSKASDFENMVMKIDNYLPRSLVILKSELYSSIKEFYGDIVKRYISEHRDEFNLLMDVDLTPTEFYDNLFAFFKSLVSQIDVFNLNFEQEMSRRLEGMGSDYAKRNKIIEDALSNNIENSRRLNIAMDTNCRAVYQTYLGNPRADFVRRLMGDRVNNVYDLDKSDCIENLIVYQMSSLRDIFGGA